MNVCCQKGHVLEPSEEAYGARGYADQKFHGATTQKLKIIVMRKGSMEYWKGNTCGQFTI